MPLGGGRGPWYLARAKALSVGLSNAYFRSVFLRYSTTASVTSRTAVYGPVCTVVWQGSAGDCRPYADQTRLPEKWTLVPIECSARAALMRPTHKITILGSPMVTQIKSIGMVWSWSRLVWVTFLSCPVIQNTKFSAGANYGRLQESSPSG